MMMAMAIISKETPTRTMTTSKAASTTIKTATTPMVHHLLMTATQRKVKMVTMTNREFFVAIA